MIKLQPSETVLIGQWIFKENKFVPDDICQRIEMLIKDHLTEIGHDSSGWAILYRDISDNRLWELSYPDSECQGGGAPQLRLVTLEEAQQKYIL